MAYAASYEYANPLILPVIEINLHQDLLSFIKQDHLPNLFFLLAVDENVPIGIISLKVLLQNIDHFSSIFPSEIMDRDFCSIKREYLTLQFIKDTEYSYVLVEQDGTWAGVIDTKLFRTLNEHAADSLIHSLCAVHNLADSENEKYFESVFDNSYDGISITDNKGFFLKINKSYERITGINRSQLIGHTAKELVANGLLSREVNSLVVAKGKSVTINQTINQKTLTVTGSPIFDMKGNVDKVITNVRDLTDIITLEKQFNLAQEISNFYQKQLHSTIGAENIVCESEVFKDVLEIAKRAAARNSTVLISGETGTGKEVIAKYIHQNSDRRNQNYLKVNCGAIAPNLLESELFGYVGGAFTGANPKGKIGVFEIANHGTVFLDEIGELPLSSQAALLTVLQEGEFTKVGDNKSQKTDVRIITATNRSLTDMIESGTFREDLYYRLNVISICVPPLRDRLRDIPKLIELFIYDLNMKYNEKKIVTLNFINQLMNLSWPGNVREMKNFIEKQFVMADEDILDSIVTTPAMAQKNKNPVLSSILTVNGLPPMEEASKELERILVTRAMEQSKSTYEAANLLKMTQSTFYRKYREILGNQESNKR